MLNVTLLVFVSFRFLFETICVELNYNAGRMKCCFECVGFLMKLETGDKVYTGFREMQNLKK